MRISARAILIVLLAAAFVGCGEEERTTRSAPPPPPTPAEEFSMLDAYGEWMSYPGYGDVWRPNVAYDWAPYRYGEWEWSDRGWMWISSERFGWVVYHYGYWNYDPRLGWLWFPAYDWAPAHVRWLVTDDVVGWAPLPPPGLAAPRPEVDRGVRWWFFVRPRDFVQSDVRMYRFGETPGFAGTESSEPPDVRFIGRTRGEDIPEYRTEESRVSEHGRELRRVETRRPETLGGTQTPTVTTPTQAPTDLPIGRKRGETTQPPVNKPPERGKTKRPSVQRPTQPAQPTQPTPPPPSPPLPPAQPAKPGAGAVQGRHATVEKGKEVVDTTKASDKKSVRPAHKR